MTLKIRIESKLDNLEAKKDDRVKILEEQVNMLKKDKNELKDKWAASAKQLEAMIEANRHE